MAGYSVTYSVVDDATAKITAINKQIAALRAPIERQQKALMQFINVSGLQKVADGFKGIAGAAAEAFSSLARLVPVIGGLTGAATVGGLIALVKSFTDLGTQLERDADYLGTSTGTLQQWQNAVKLAGGSVGDLTESMKGLARTSADAFTGKNTEALARFGQAGIALKDANGHLRTTTELLPEVLKYIDSFTNAQDRQAVAMQLGGQALYELDEDFRRSGQSIDTWMTKAGKVGSVIDPATLQRYRQAVGELDVAFTGLSTSITGVLAEALAPLITQLSTWVNEHQADIVKAINDIATAFKNWVNNTDWTALREGLSAVGSALGSIITAGKWLAANPTIAGAILGAAAGGATAGPVGAVAGALGGGLAGAALDPRNAYQQQWDAAKAQYNADKNAGRDQRGFDQFSREWHAAHPPPKSMQHGGIVPINAHAGEIVLPAALSRGLLGMINAIQGGAGASSAGDTTARSATNDLLSWLSGTLVPKVQIDNTDDLAHAGFGAPGGFPAPGGGGGGGPSPAAGPSPAGAPSPAFAPGGKTSWTPPADLGQAGAASKSDPRGMIPVIRAAAIANGVDPDIAVRVAQHEGLGTFLGDHGKSGSAFQLYTGGGLGNEFQKQTGLDPLDPKNEKQAIWWSMQNVGRTGWSPWHGAARAGVGDREGLGGAPGAGGAPALPGGGKILASPAAAGVRPQLTAAMSQAFKSVLPEGYTAKLTSGVRSNNPSSQHYTGNAEDWQIFDPQGNKISNRGADTRGFYRAAAVAGLANLMKTNPELAKKFAWGGHFETSAGSGVADLMHYDLGGARGRFGDPLGERADAARLAALGMPAAEGAPAQVTGGAPVKGSVDVTVTHRNPPPTVDLNATATGSVNLVGPRTEQQQFGNA